MAVQFPRTCPHAIGGRSITPECIPSTFPHGDRRTGPDLLSAPTGPSPAAVRAVLAASWAAASSRFDTLPGGTRRGARLRAWRMGAWCPHASPATYDTANDQWTLAGRFRVGFFAWDGSSGEQGSAWRWHHATSGARTGPRRRECHFPVDADARDAGD